MGYLPINNAASAEQLMLHKMDAMQTKLQADFVVQDNPINSLQGSNALSFSEAMYNVLNVVDGFQTRADDKMTAVETGKSDDLVGAMIASQKATLSFNSLLQVRNKVVASFDDIMKMPV